MASPLLTIGEIEREWARRGIQSDQAHRITQGDYCLFWDHCLGEWRKHSDAEYRGLLAVYAMRFYGIEYKRANPNTKAPWRFWIPATKALRKSQQSREASGPVTVDCDVEKADAVAMALMMLVPEAKAPERKAGAAE